MVYPSNTGKGRRTVTVTLRLTEEEGEHCKGKGNRSEYIQYLIQQDMLKEGKGIDEIGQRVQEEVEKIFKKLNIKMPEE